MSATAHIATIARIDLDIDALYAELMMRVRCCPGQAWGWQTAWDRCPDLHARHSDLFRQRGDVQLLRDAALHREWQSEQRRERARQRAHRPTYRPCPTCGNPMMEAA